MKKISIVILFSLLAGLLLATTQALAGPASAIAAKGTHGPRGTDDETAGPGTLGPPAHTPGAAATAHAGLHGKPQIMRGTLNAVDASSLTVTLGDGSSVTVGLTPATRIHIPGGQDSGASLQAGMQIMVMAYTDASSNLTARMVLAIPGQPVRAHRVGTVTAYTPGSSITIQAKDGSTFTFSLASDLKILPEEHAGDLAVGSLVTVIAPRVPSSLGWTARGIVVHPAGS